MSVGVESVEPSGDDALHRARELRGREVGDGSIRRHPCELLRVQRVPARADQERRLQLRGQDGAVEEFCEQHRGLLVRQGRERERRRVELPAAPARPTDEELRPRRAHDQEWDVARPVDQLVEEVEEAVVGPVQILEHQHGRAALGECLEEATPGRGPLLHRLRAGVSLLGQPDQGAQVACDPALLVLLRDQLGHAPVELVRRLAIGVRLQDARLGLDHLAERPIAHAVSVGQAPALSPGDQVRHPFDVDEELVHQAALPDARLADQRDELRLGLMSRSIEGVPEERELPLSPDERGVDATGDVDAVAGPRLDRLPGGHGLGLALRLDRLGRPVLDRALRRAVRRLAHEDPVDRRGGLEPGRRVHHVARGHALALRGGWRRARPAPRRC